MGKETKKLIQTEEPQVPKIGGEGGWRREISTQRSTNLKRK